MEGKPTAETFTQGIENGVTFIFMTGSNLIASKYDTWTIPGFRNTFHTSSGSDGIRLIIHSPDMGPMPNLDGIDVSPGMDTTIGITSKEDIRLPHPYSKCSTHNIEELLMKSVEATLGYKPIEDDGMVLSKYNVGKCRGTCFLRHVWEECGCLLLSENLPFLNSSLLCGHNKYEIFLNPKKYGMGHCFNRENMFKAKCRNFLEPLFTDLKCIRKVTRILDHKPDDTKERILKCSCPVPCHTRDYDLTVGTSVWPSPGPELNAAYNTIVKKTVIPNLQQSYNTSLTVEAIAYLSKEDDRYETS